MLNAGILPRFYKHRGTALEALSWLQLFEPGTFGEVRNAMSSTMDIKELTLRAAMDSMGVALGADKIPPYGWWEASTVNNLIMSDKLYAERLGAVKTSDLTHLSLKSANP